jgi:hypothetical protein
VWHWFHSPSVRALLYCCQEGNYKSFGGDLEAMKSYLMTKLLLNPGLNETQVMEDFLIGWYGREGAIVIRR